MLPTALTDRQRREIAFYEQYADLQRVDAVDFEPVLGRSTRPWNPYWFVYQKARQRYVSPRQRLLEFGCGIGIAAVRFAALGYDVDGFDLSRTNLDVAAQLAERHALADRCRFTPMAAESLDYPDDTFDVVTGIDILHHVDIPHAVAEARRVLKPGGIAIFKEHIQAPVVDALRQSAPVRQLVPSEASLDDHITHDERKLTADDLALIERHFDRVETHRFTLVSRLDRLAPGNGGDALRSRLQKLDHRLLQSCPALQRFAGTVVLTCHKA